MATGLFYNNLPTILFTARNSDLILISVKNISKYIYIKNSAYIVFIEIKFAQKG